MGDFLDKAPRRTLSEMAESSPSRIAAELVALFGHISRLPDKVQWVHREIAADLGEPLDAALERGCSAVASIIDANARSFDRHPYHNRQHFCEVALTGYILCLLSRQGVRMTQFMLLAALVHDFVHEGASSETFLLERASVEQVRGILEQAGLDATDLRRLTVLVLSTDPKRGNAFMAAACRFHSPGGGAPPELPPGAPELAELLIDAHLAELARLLCEADILPSIGLNLAHAMQLQQRLAHEWGRPLDARDKLAFIDAVLGHHIVGAFFLPNVQEMRAALTGELHEHAPG